MGSFFRQFNAIGPLFVHYALLPYVLSTSFSTHPKPLTWDKKPFQSRRVLFPLFSTLWDFPPFFGTLRLFTFLIFSPKFFLLLQRLPPSIFRYFATEWMFKKSQRVPPFTFFATYRRLQRKIGFFFPQFLVFWELLLSPVVEKVVFESYWALDMAPTLADPGLF